MKIATQGVHLYASAYLLTVNLSCNIFWCTSIVQNVSIEISKNKNIEAQVGHAEIMEEIEYYWQSMYNKRGKKNREKVVNWFNNGYIFIFAFSHYLEMQWIFPYGKVLMVS